MDSQQEKARDKRTKDILLGILAPMALDSNHGAHSGWFPLMGKKEEFPPPQDSGAPLLAPAFCKKTLEHIQSRQATAIPTSRLGLARPTGLLRANKVRTDAQVSPRSIASHPRSGG